MDVGVGMPTLAPPHPPMCLSFLFSGTVGRWCQKEHFVMRSRTSALEAAVLQVGAGSSMGSPLFPTLLLSSSSQPSMARAESQNCQTRRARLWWQGRTQGCVSKAGPWGVQLPPSLLGLTPLMACLIPTRCSSAYVGERCQHPNPCLSSPCKNAGTCTPVVRGSTVDYTCACRLGFTDELCLTPRDNVCLSNPCRNGGTCELLTLSEYKCRCPPGWSGEAMPLRGTGTR